MRTKVEISFDIRKFFCSFAAKFAKKGLKKEVLLRIQEL